MEANYKDRKRDGLFKEGYENGQIRELANLKDGKRYGLLKNGIVMDRLEKNQPKNGRKDGLSKVWYENGQLVHEINYMYGKPYGVVKKWSEDGQLIETLDYGPNYNINIDTIDKITHKFSGVYSGETSDEWLGITKWEIM